MRYDLMDSIISDLSLAIPCWQYNKKYEYIIREREVNYIVWLQVKGLKRHFQHDTSK